jgi:hypothetical protein
MIAQWKADLAALTEPYTIRAIIWVHGEQDGNNSTDATSANRYARSLARLNDRIHEDLGLDGESVPLLISKLATDFYAHSATVRQQQINADADSGHADAISNAILVDTAGLAFYDGRHYTEESRQILGTRLADSLAAANAVPAPSALSSGIIMLLATALMRRKLLS